MGTYGQALAMLWLGSGQAPFLLESPGVNSRVFLMTTQHSTRTIIITSQFHNLVKHRPQLAGFDFDSVVIHSALAQLDELIKFQGFNVSKINSISYEWKI